MGQSDRGSARYPAVNCSDRLNSMFSALWSILTFPFRVVGWMVAIWAGSWGL